MSNNKKITFPHSTGVVGTYWTVDAGALAKLVRLPALLMRRAATVSPMSADRLGATIDIFSLKSQI